MADRPWAPSTGLVAGLSVAQTLLWSLPAALGIRSTIDSSTGPLFSKPTDALAWLLIALLYGGIGLVGGVTGLVFAWQARQARGAKAKNQAARRGWWANIVGAAVQFGLWIAFFLAIGSVHGR